MSYAFVQDVAASWQQYERFSAAISLRPEGLVLHVAGATDEGFRIIGIWESESAWDRFQAEQLRDHASVGPTNPPATFRALQPMHIVFGRTVERWGSSGELGETLGDGIRQR
jgi:hypothetical protein